LIVEFLYALKYPAIFVVGIFIIFLIARVITWSVLSTIDRYRKQRKEEFYGKGREKKDSET
jgi:hypothetical protein